jgi:hypothetical protein
LPEGWAPVSDSAFAGVGEVGEVVEGKARGMVETTRSWERAREGV